MCFSGVLLGANIFNTLSGICFSIKWLFIFIFIRKKSALNGYLSICVEISKECGNGLAAMVGRLTTCAIYTNKFTFGQLKPRLDL